MTIVVMVIDSCVQVRPGVTVLTLSKAQLKTNHETYYGILWSDVALAQEENTMKHLSVYCVEWRMESKQVT